MSTLALGGASLGVLAPQASAPTETSTATDVSEANTDGYARADTPTQPERTKVNLKFTTVELDPSLPEQDITLPERWETLTSTLYDSAGDKVEVTVVHSWDWDNDGEEEPSGSVTRRAVIIPSGVAYPVDPNGQQDLQYQGLVRLPSGVKAIFFYNQPLPPVGDTPADPPVEEDPPADDPTV